MSGFSGVGAMAWRESRNGRRRLLLFMSAISAGVAALVAIDSLSSNVTRSVRQQSRTLLGGDIAFSSRREFPATVERILDSLPRSGIRVSRVTTFGSMATVAHTEGTRYAQIRAVTAEYPFYGVIETTPARRWPELHRGRNALVDPSLLISLDANVGDSLSLGFTRFAIIGTIESVPGDPGITAALGPRVFIPAQYIEDTGLLGMGSRAEFDALLRLPEGRNAASLVKQLKPRLDSASVRSQTVEQTERNLTEAIRDLSRFLGLVGLVALLLGGVGVASAIHAYVAEKRDTAAILRCLGASGKQVMAIYVIEAAAMGLVGATAGVVAGLFIQFALPRAIGDFIPVDVQLRLEPTAIAAGFGVGVLVAILFAIRPLLALRQVSPLQTLRQDASPTLARRVWRDGAQMAAVMVLALSVVGVAIVRTGSWKDGLVVAAGLAAALGILWGSAALLTYTARRALRERWPFVVRQGIANLYRPANQTRPVMLSLGFGAFLLSTLYLVQTNLLSRLQISSDATQANLVLFDIQEDQINGVDSLVRASGFPVLQRVPVVPMRIAAVNGTSTADLARNRPTWSLRREYRSSYRDTLMTSEKLVAGQWFDKTPSTRDDSIFQISVDKGIAEDVPLKIGDRVRWDVQGVQIESRVTSFREVNFARFEPNFFVIFEQGALEQAPQSFVILTNASDPATRTRMQRATVDRYPNVTSIDLSLIQTTVRGILGRVAVAVRFMALFSLVTGILVLLGAVSASRRQRIREGVLLKTLGATRAQIRKIMFAEYAALGVLGSATGMLLSIAGAWGVMRFGFKAPFALAVVPLFAIAAGMMLLTVTIGLLSGRHIFAEPPMKALREV
ncbi:MAG: ABC transporter permease [Gemmatimonadota bacterium]|nr:ABC transporter permease [Gemmatimonadota bacterium]